MELSMDWSKRLKLLSLLLQSGMKGTETLYETIPFFMRIRLHSFINDTLWSQLNVECEENLPKSQEKAMYYYHELLKRMEAYIDDIRMQMSCANKDNATFMRLAKNLVEKEFGNDAVKFVKEIDLCLSRERELIYMNTVPEEEEVMYTDETDIPERRLKYKVLMTQLEKDINDMKMTLKELMIQDQSLVVSPPKTTLDTFQLNKQDNTQIYSEMATLVQRDLSNMLNNIMLKLDNMMGSLEQEVGAWQTAESLASVKTGLKIDLTYIAEDFSNFGRMLNMMSIMLSEDNRLQQLCQVASIGGLSPGHIGTLSNQFNLVEERYFSCNLVVTDQPKKLISIENKDVKTTKQKGGGAKSGEKKETCYRSKKRQYLKTTVLLLGAKSFTGLTIRETDIELVADKDLAEEKERKNHGEPGQAAQKCAKIDGVSTTTDDLEYYIDWPDLHVTEFTRLDTTAVYRQFFRFRYTVRLEVHHNEYTLKALSQPFTFNTGANQQLEHTGSRLWYCANVDMYHGDFMCPNFLPVESVMDMLNKRVMHITKKQRALTDDDKSFIQSRLTVNSDNTVSIQSFIKEKLSKTVKMPSTSISNDDVPSFYTWFHGVMNALTHTIAKPWEIGIIYGFCSEQQAKEKLLDENILAGTVLLRPSMSKVENMSSKHANTALIMEVKMKALHAESNRGVEVISVPLFISFIRDNGFYRAIKGIKKDKESIAKFLYGMDGSVKLVDVLMEFGKGQRKADVFEGYGLMINKMEFMHIEPINKEEFKGENENRPDSKKPKLSKRKWLPESYPSTMSPSTDNSLSPPRTFTVLQTTSAQSNVSVGTKVEDTPGTSSSFTGIARTFIEEKDPAVHDQQPLKFTQMGGVSVDVSKLSMRQTVVPLEFVDISTGNDMSTGWANTGFGSIYPLGPDSPLDMFNQPHENTSRNVRRYEATTLSSSCLPKLSQQEFLPRQLSGPGTNQVSQKHDNILNTPLSNGLTTPQYNISNTPWSNGLTTPQYNISNTNKYDMNFTTPQFDVSMTSESDVFTTPQCGGNIPNNLHEAQERSKVRKSQVRCECGIKTNRPEPRSLETNLQGHQGEYSSPGHEQQFIGKSVSTWNLVDCVMEDKKMLMDAFLQQEIQLPNSPFEQEIMESETTKIDNLGEFLDTF